MLRMPVRLVRQRGPVWRFEGKAYVGETLYAEAEYSAMLTDRGFPGSENSPDVKGA
jgi:3-hydroxyacyl-[acyl-carrier-protein] dehydratase